MAGVPIAVHGAFILGSPVVDNPRGAAPGAAGVRTTGVDLKSSAKRFLLSAMKRFVVARSHLQSISNHLGNRRVEPVPEFLEAAFVNHFGRLAASSFFNVSAMSIDLMRMPERESTAPVEKRSSSPARIQESGPALQTLVLPPGPRNAPALSRARSCPPACA